MAASAGKTRISLGMRVVVESTDPVRVSFLLALLRDAGIKCIVLDSHISALEGGIGAFPRRLAVVDDDLAQALRVLREAGEAPA
jgi:Putative prokaryotic signal transducing protein